MVLCPTTLLGSKQQLKAKSITAQAMTRGIRRGCYSSSLDKSNINGVVVNHSCQDINVLSKNI
eukprot:TRINITY_DN4147_c0_g1_i1.p2 TRINITY_DN4147_c0_g1~~TRINITY_DN4147_c0_g1_i1.p2  ORF type:complete len:63 (-),score=1.87 TRINITY_DN4147_c0_g1_i1:118-306(-)